MTQELFRTLALLRHSNDLLEHITVLIRHTANLIERATALVYYIMALLFILYSLEKFFSQISGFFSLYMEIITNTFIRYYKNESESTLQGTRIPTPARHK